MEVLSFLGLVDEVDANKERKSLLKRFSTILCSAFLLLPSLTAFLMHLDDVEQALEALYYFSVQLLVNSQFMCIIIARRSFNEMWNQMKSNVTSRTANGHGKSYTFADKLFDFLNKWVLVLFSSTAMLILLPSLVITIYNNYKLAAMEPSSWNLPFLLAFPFSTTNASAYAFVYIISAVNLLSNMICKMAIQEIFIRTGFHVIASCYDLRDSFSHLDTIYDRCDNRNKNMKRSAISYEVKRQVKDIIKYHGEIDNLFRSFSSVVSGIVFFEYTIIIVLLASVGVFVAQDGHILSTEGSMMKFKFICVCGIASVLMSSMLGSEITYQKMEIAKYVYLTNWGDWPTEVIKYVPMILRMGQKSRCIYGYGIVLCDLETFKATMNTVVSVIILLKQME